MRLYKVGEADGFHPQVPPALLCWFGGLRRDASLLLPSPYPPFSLSSRHPLVHLFVFQRIHLCLKRVLPLTVCK